MLANDLIFEVEMVDGGAPIRLVANPVQFNHAKIETTRARAVGTYPNWR